MEFRVLGPLMVQIDGHRHEIRGPRLRAVLAALLVRSNEPVSVHRLSAMVWGEDSPADPRAVLHTYATRVRKTLRAVGSAARIEYDPAGYRIQVADGAVDISVFRNLVQRADDLAGRNDFAGEYAALCDALRLWRGAPLSDIESDQLQREVVPELTESWLRAVDRRIALDLRFGRSSKVIDELRDLTTRYPLREGIWHQLMTALYLCGRRAEALEAFRALRRRMDDELGIEPGPAVRELHHALLNNALPTEIGDPTGPAAPVTAERPVPAQLPAGPSTFTGRTRELAELSQVLAERAGVGRIATIGGSGGIGKTALALYWAHRHTHLFPAGQLHVNLRGFDPAEAPLSPTMALRGFLDALGVPPSALPVDPDALAGLYRSLVAGRKMLVVLDDARDAAQVEPLLPGTPSCAVIVTSRDRLTGLVSRYGARPFDLTMFDDDEARRLLAGRLTPQRLAVNAAAVSGVIHACGGLPLALGIVAARATVTSTLSLPALAAELADAGTRLDALDEDHPQAGLRSVLATSYEALPPDQARLFCLLGRAPGPDIGLPAVIALAGAPSADTARLLRGLERRSLLVRHAEQRWRMHDLVRLYAAERADQDVTGEDRRLALRHLIDHYLYTAYAADRLLGPNRVDIALGEAASGARPQPFPDKAAASGWLDAEHPNLLAAQRIAAELGEHPVVWQLAWALDTFCRWRGNVGDHLAVWRLGVAAAERISDPPTLALARRLLGHVCVLAGEPDEAMTHLTGALALAEQADDLYNQAYTHRTIARAHSLRGDDQLALDHAVHSLRLFELLRDTPRQADALNAAGWCAIQLGRYGPAAEYLTRALALAGRQDDRGAEATVRDSLGCLDHRLGRYQRARDHYGQAIVLLGELGAMHSMADTLDRLGDTHAAAGECRAARQAWQRALTLYQLQYRTGDVDRLHQRLDVTTARCGRRLNADAWSPCPDCGSLGTGTTR